MVMRFCYRGKIFFFKSIWIKHDINIEIQLAGWYVANTLTYKVPFQEKHFIFLVDTGIPKSLKTNCHSTQLPTFKVRYYSYLSWVNVRQPSFVSASGCFFLLKYKHTLHIQYFKMSQIYNYTVTINIALETYETAGLKDKHVSWSWRNEFIFFPVALLIEVFSFLANFFGVLVREDSSVQQLYNSTFIWKSGLASLLKTRAFKMLEI